MGRWPVGPIRYSRVRGQWSLKQKTDPRPRVPNGCCHHIGPTAFKSLPFKVNTTGRGSATWRRPYTYFMLNESELNEHYHRRSNVETTFSMVRSKFEDSVRAKSETGMVNEILLKFLCHNICALNHEMYEIGIEASLEPGATLC